MLDLFQFVHRFGTDAPGRGRVRADSRISLLQFLEAMEKLVIDGIGDFGAVFGIVKIIMISDAFPERLRFFPGFLFAQVIHIPEIRGGVFLEIHLKSPSMAKTRPGRHRVSTNGPPKTHQKAGADVH